MTQTHTQDAPVAAAARCAGAENCRRPAVWTIVDYGHSIYLEHRSFYASGRPRYCKGHGQAELARQKAELPDAERKRRWDIIGRRRAVLARLREAVEELASLDRQADLLAQGGYLGGVNRGAPDPWYAGFLTTLRDQAGIGREDLGRLRRIVDILQEELGTNIPPAVR